VAQDLTDAFGRVHRDLRISVTDRCSFRCTYCMPEEGLPWLPREQVLRFEEIERVARLCVERFGFGSIRLTGGEPTVRASLPELVRRLAALDVDLSMTTNGATLRLLASELRAAGLRRVNVSCDSLRRERYGQGMEVILIEPGGVKTPIWDKSNEMADQIQQQMPPDAERIYGKLIAGVRKATIEIAQDKGIEAREVAETIGRAMTAKRPRTRYLVGTDAKIRGPMAKILPDRLMDRAVAKQLGI